VAKFKIKYTSCLLIIILLFAFLFSFDLNFNRTVKADGLASNDLIKGAGVAVTLIVLSQLFLGSRDSQRESREIDRDIEIEEDDFNIFEREIEKKDIFVDVNPEEIEMLTRIISGEARGEPLEGQIAVGAVVLNRVLSDDFPDTIEEVIFAEGQFIAIDDGYYDMQPTEKSYRAAIKALEGKDPSNGAYYFYNPVTARTLWWLTTRETTAEIGNHVFAK